MAFFWVSLGRKFTRLKEFENADKCYHRRRLSYLTLVSGDDTDGSVYGLHRRSSHCQVLSRVSALRSVMEGKDECHRHGRKYGEVLLARSTFWEDMEVLWKE